MRTLINRSLLALGLATALSTSASAQQLGFDDVTSAPYAWLTNGYGGFNWSNAYVMNGPAWYGSAAAAGGFSTGRHSGNYVMSNGGAADLGISRSTAFDLVGGYFAASWTHGLTVNAVGSYQGNTLYTRTFNLDWNVSQYINFDMSGVDQVLFSNSGGVVDAQFNSGSNRSFVVDDLILSSPKGSFRESSVIPQDVVPEPMTLGLVGLGLLAVGGLKLRGKRIVAA